MGSITSAPREGSRCGSAPRVTLLLTERRRVAPKARLRHPLEGGCKAFIRSLTGRQVDPRPPLLDPPTHVRLVEPCEARHYDGGHAGSDGGGGGARPPVMDHAPVPHTRRTGVRSAVRRGRVHGVGSAHCPRRVHGMCGHIQCARTSSSERRRRAARRRPRTRRATRARVQGPLVRERAAGTRGAPTRRRARGAARPSTASRTRSCCRS